MSTRIDTDPLLDRIETALDLYGISATRFGYEAAGDPTLVGKLRSGRRVKKPALRDAIEAALDRLERI